MGGHPWLWGRGSELHPSLHPLNARSTLVMRTTDVCKQSPGSTAWCRGTREAWKGIHALQSLFICSGYPMMPVSPLVCLGNLGFTDFQDSNPCEAATGCPHLASERVKTARPRALLPSCESKEGLQGVLHLCTCPRVGARSLIASVSHL